MNKLHLNNELLAQLWLIFKKKKKNKMTQAHFKTLLYDYDYIIAVLTIKYCHIITLVSFKLWVCLREFYKWVD